jgi:hypothetical protein
MNIIKFSICNKHLKKLITKNADDFAKQNISIPTFIVSTQNLFPTFAANF